MEFEDQLHILLYFHLQEQGTPQEQPQDGTHNQFLATVVDEYY